jgi:hypothetical protein
MPRRSHALRSQRQRVTVWLVALVTVAAVARFWGLRFGLPQTNARPDENVIIDVTVQFLRGHFRPTFYDYPWLYMWTATGLYLLYYVWGLFTGLFNSLADFAASWRTNWIPFFVINRALSAVLGSATVLVVFRIARRLWDEGTGLIAALFMALAFLHVRDSHYGTTDVTMTFLLMLSLSCLIGAHLENRRGHFLAAGLIGGFAAAAKYNALLLAVPIVASYALNVFEAAGGRIRAARDPRLLLFGIPFLAGFLIGAPFLLFDLDGFLQAMAVLRRSMEDGLGEGNLSPGWIHHLQYSLRYGLGLPLLVAGIAGMAVIVAQQPAIAMLLFSFPIAYYAVAGSAKNQFFRYAIPLVPFLCIAAARLVAWVVPAFASHVVPRLSRTLGRRLPFVAPTALVGVLAVAIVLPSAISVFQFDRIMSRTDNRVVVARWFDQNVAAGSSVLMTGSFYGYIHFTREMGYNAWVWDRRRHIFVTDLDKRPGVGYPEWILVQDSPLPNETQPIVTALLQRDYALVRQFHAFSRKGDPVYDQQDAFFAPFARFRGVERPGPNYALYKRIGDR